MASVEELKEFFANSDESIKQFAFDTIDEYAYFKEQIDYLKTLPMIRVSKNDPANQISTPASKLIKDYSNIIDSKRSTLLKILYSNNSGDEVDNFLEKLKEFK